jgi:hypothetical protein
VSFHRQPRVRTFVRPTYVLGVQPRESTDISSLPSVVPLRVVLSDHRAGEGSLFAYPWCE